MKTKRDEIDEAGECMGEYERREKKEIVRGTRKSKETEEWHVTKYEH